MQTNGPEIAYNKGYRVRGNNVYSPKGKKRKCLIVKGSPYPRFTVWYNGKMIHVKCHQLAAWQKFGAKVYGDGIEVRHIDDDCKNFRIENIELGLREDNIADRYMNDFLQHWIEEVNAEAKQTLESEVPF